MWTYTEALEAWLDLGILEDWPSNRIPGFVDRLLEAIPSIGAHYCSPGVPNGFLMRLREGTWMGHVLEHIVIELLEAAGLEAGFGQTRETIMNSIWGVTSRHTVSGHGINRTVHTTSRSTNRGRSSRPSLGAGGWPPAGREEPRRGFESNRLLRP